MSEAKDWPIGSVFRPNQDRILGYTSLDFKENSVTLTVWIKPHAGEDNWILYDGDGGRAAYALVHDDRAASDTFGVSFWNTAGVRVR